MESLLFDPPFSETRAFATVFSTWFISQFIKALIQKFRKQSTGFRWMFATGGMPSSHSATVSSLSACTGYYFGFHSMTFLIVLVFSLITMFDAAGVRRNVGRQAKVLNKMLDEFYEKGVVQENRLKELLGHTPVEVFMGAFLGFFIAFILCRVTV